MKVSKSSKINFAAGVGADLFLQGCTSIPNLLLKHYRGLGITDSEMFLLIHLLRIKDEDKDYFPSPEKIAQVMTSSVLEIEEILNSLIEKEILTIEQYWQEELHQHCYTYRYEALYAKLSEFWACEKFKELQKGRTKQKLPNSFNETAAAIAEDHEISASLVFRSFQREFGRLLTSIELEQIKQWLDVDKFSPDLIQEGLKRAVLMGKLNFKYVDKILLEWKKNNIRNFHEIQVYDEDFKNRQAAKSQSRTAAPRQTPVEPKNSDKYKNLFRN